MRTLWDMSSSAPSAAPSRPRRLRATLVLHESCMLYEVAIAAEVFGVDRNDLSPTGRWYDVVVATADGRPHPWTPGLPAAGYDVIDRSDTVIVTSTSTPGEPADPRLIDALARAHRRGARIAGLCTGAFILAEAGVLDGREAATHWMHADALARLFPAVRVRPDLLYVDDSPVLTSAGKTAALDLCQHIVSTDLGASAANGLARRLVTPAQRAGGQAQYIPVAEVPAGSDIGPTLEWARRQLHTPLGVEDLARHAGLSRRHFARRMRTELRQAPLAWLREQRLMRARELLEASNATVEQVASRCGIDAAALRRQFQEAFGVSPTAYRANFR